MFISSTFEDLKEERQAAVEAVLRAGHIPAGMELFAAGSESQWETIKEWIEASDVYLLILGGRYGTLKGKTGVSYTAHEYQYAVDLDKPLFSVVIHQEYLDQKVLTDGQRVLEMKCQQQYEEFKDRVTNKTVRFFKSDTELKLAIVETLIDFQRRHDLTGWVRGTDIDNASKFAHEILRLTEANATLRKEADRLATELKAARTKMADPFGEIRDVLHREMVTMTIEGERQEYSCLLLAMTFADDLVLGVSNAHDVSTKEAELYYRVAPKLAKHGLMEDVKVPIKYKWKKMRLSKKGKEFLAKIDLLNAPEKDS